MADKNALGGFKEIQECCGRMGLPSSAASVLDMIKYQGLPAKKIGGTWISDSDLIEKWRKEYIEGKPQDKKAQNGRKHFLGVK